MNFKGRWRVRHVCCSTADTRTRNVRASVKRISGVEMVEWSVLAVRIFPRIFDLRGSWSKIPISQFARKLCSSTLRKHFQNFEIS